jgi:nucleoside-diphosphate-sugar epimerase
MDKVETVWRYFCSCLPLSHACEDDMEFDKQKQERGVLLVGGAGSLGAAITARLKNVSTRKYVPFRFDVDVPNDVAGGVFIHGSTLDAGSIAYACETSNAPVVVHLAGWNQSHFDCREKSRTDFFKLNIQGTFVLLSTLCKLSVKKFLYISSTSVLDPSSVSGWACLTCETMVRHFAASKRMKVVILRLAPCTPPYITNNYSRWCQEFWRDGVLLDDASDCVICALEYLFDDDVEYDHCTPLRPVTVASSIGCSLKTLRDWDMAMKQRGATTGRTTNASNTLHDTATEFFIDAYGDDLLEVAKRNMIDITAPPLYRDNTLAMKMLNWSGPMYSKLDMLRSLRTYGSDGPPLPHWKETQRGSSIFTDDGVEVL